MTMAAPKEIKIYFRKEGSRYDIFPLLDHLSASVFKNLAVAFKQIGEGDYASFLHGYAISRGKGDNFEPDFNEWNNGRWELDIEFNEFLTYESNLILHLIPEQYYNQVFMHLTRADDEKLFNIAINILYNSKRKRT